jgi:heme exporter protein D
MKVQNRPQGGFASNIWLQFALLVIAVVVLIAVAAKYIW